MKHCLNHSITKSETRIKALQTMVSNHKNAEAEKQATIAELEDYMKNHFGDAIEKRQRLQPPERDPGMFVTN